MKKNLIFCILSLIVWFIMLWRLVETRGYFQSHPGQLFLLIIIIMLLFLAPCYFWLMYKSDLDDDTGGTPTFKP